jgi:hypothetical protein
MGVDSYWYHWYCLPSGVFAFSGFIAYNTQFGDQVGGPPSFYANPVLLAGTITLVIEMWISALAIGKSTESLSRR